MSARCPSSSSWNGRSRPCPVTVFTTWVSRPSSICVWKSLPPKIIGCGPSAKVAIIALTIESHIQPGSSPSTSRAFLRPSWSSGTVSGRCSPYGFSGVSCTAKCRADEADLGVRRGAAPRVDGDPAVRLAGLLVVPRVDVVLDQVVALRVVAVRAAALLVDERVRDRVGADVRRVAEREGEELPEPVLALVRPVAQQLGLARRGCGTSRSCAGSGTCRSTGTRSPASPSARRCRSCRRCP